MIIPLLFPFTCNCADFQITVCMVEFHSFSLAPRPKLLSCCLPSSQLIQRLHHKILQAILFVAVWCMISETLLMPPRTTKILVREGPKRVQWWERSFRISHGSFKKKIFPTLHLSPSCPYQSLYLLLTSCPSVQSGPPFNSIYNQI